jgi:hypothetical protein
MNSDQFRPFPTFWAERSFGAGAAGKMAQPPTVTGKIRFHIKHEGGAQTVRVVRQATPTKCTFDLEME